jgi:hypothetical protein
MIDEELIRSAQINFENLERAVPQLKVHPFYRIAKAQLDEGLGGKSMEESLHAALPPSPCSAPDSVTSGGI